MDSEINRSFSDSNIRLSGQNITPPNYVAFRNKRCRDVLEDETLQSFKQDLLTAMQTMMQKQENEIKNIKSILQDIKKTNVHIENSISFLAEQNEEFKRRIEKLECENKKDKEYITLLEDRLEDSRREKQKGNFEIKNVPKLEPKETKEDLINMVLCLSKSIDCSINEHDICDIYRTRAKREGTKNTPIIVETNSNILKLAILQKCKMYNTRNKDKLRAKHLGFKTKEDTPIYISEQLTPKGARLYFLARDLARTKAYTFCWTSHGRVFVRKTTDSPVILIKYRKKGSGSGEATGAENRVACNPNTGARDLGEKQVCDVPVDEFHPCTSANQYNYEEAGPCVFLKLNKIFNWVPQPYNSTEDVPSNMPDDLKQHIKMVSGKPEANTVWVSCEGENPADVENIGPVQYIPRRGFPAFYYPFTNKEGYLSPLVAVLFEKPRTGVLINIECKAWAKNIQYDRYERRGSVHFELMVDRG